MARIRPKNWKSFQHYRDRDPTWIKLHKRLLDDFEFHSLPLASQALAPMLWLLASEDKEGWIDADPKRIAFRLRRTAKEISESINPLIDGGFFELEHCASKTLAEVEPSASPENKRQVETQEEEQEQEIARSADADEPQLALQAYNSVAKELNWPGAVKLTNARLSKLRTRLTECGGIAGWEDAMAKARASPWLRGETRRGKGFENWTPDLDFFLQQASFTKLLEGKYDERSNPNQTTGLSGIIAAARLVADQ